jgi:Translocon-associated protein (TRAP), alpha subunit
VRPSNSSQDPVEEDISEDKLQSPKLAVSVAATFPEAEIFGIKLVNGKPTKALLSISNEEPEPVTVKFIGGVLWTPPFDPQGSRIVRNLTATRYNIEIPAGEKQSLPYNFVTELHPQDLRLELAAIMSSSDGKDFAIQAFNETISIVEPDTSIFDPQM